VPEVSVKLTVQVLFSMTRGVKNSQTVSREGTRVDRMIREGLVYRQNEQRLAVRTKAEALIRKD